MFDFSYEFWVANVIGILLTIGSIVFTRRKKNRVSYISEGIVVIEKPDNHAAQDITVSFKQKVIPRLSVSRFKFWNSGNDTIHGNAVVSSDHFRVEVPETASIVEWYIDAEIPKGRSVQVSPVGPNVLHISFDFLNTRDGFALRLLHTAEPKDAQVFGSFRGFMLDVGSVSLEKRTWFLSAIYTVSTVFLGGILFAALLDASPLFTNKGVDIIAKFAFVIVYAGAVVYFEKMLPRLIRRGIPKGLG